MKRREFIALAATAAATGDSAAKMAAPHMESRRPGGSMTGNAPGPPATGVRTRGGDRSNGQEVHTTSHGHCENQKMLDAYLDRGRRFFRRFFRLRRAMGYATITCVLRRGGVAWVGDARSRAKAGRRARAESPTQSGRFK